MVVVPILDYERNSVGVLQAINKVGQEGEVFVFECPLVRLRRSSSKESLGGKDRFSEWFL